MLPLSPSARHSEVMNSHRGSPPSVAKNSLVFWLRSGFPLNVERPLKCELIERTHSREPWDRRIHALKIHEIERVLQILQLLAEFRTEPCLTRLHARASNSLLLSEREVIGYVGDGLGAHLLQFFSGTGMESWQVADVVIWERGIAAVEEFARNGVCAMGTGWDLWSHRHNENTKL